MSAQIINLADHRRIVHPATNLLALSFGLFAAYLFVGAAIFSAIVQANQRR